LPRAHDREKELRTQTPELRTVISETLLIAQGELTRMRRMIVQSTGS